MLGYIPREIDKSTITDAFGKRIFPPGRPTRPSEAISEGLRPRIHGLSAETANLELKPDAQAKDSLCAVDTQLLEIFEVDVGRGFAGLCLARLVNFEIVAFEVDRLLVRRVNFGGCCFAEAFVRLVETGVERFHRLRGFFPFGN